jgi:hypothetical protein
MSYIGIVTNPVTSKNDLPPFPVLDPICFHSKMVTVTKNIKYRNLQCIFFHLQSLLLSMCLQSMVDELISQIRVITKLPNSEQSYKGKVKTHKYINRQSQSTTGKL